jgi:hypothetical protein
MADEARLMLRNVRLGSSRGSLFVFGDRLELATDDGDRRIPITDIERVANRRSIRGSRLLIAIRGGQVIEVRRLSASDTATAHRVILAIARAAH